MSVTVHSGLSPDLSQLEGLSEYDKPQHIPAEGVLCDLVFADPEPDLVGWGEVGRAPSYIFGADILSKWLRANDLKMVIRAHQVVEHGFEWFAEKQLLTLFSCPDYVGEFENDGAVMIVDADLNYKMSVIRSGCKGQSKSE